MRLSALSFAAVALLAGTAQVHAADYAIDPTHTFATFEIGHMGASTNRGRFDKKEGTVQFDRAAKTGKVEVSVDVTPIRTRTPPFNTHLPSADLVDAANYPTATIVSDKLHFYHNTFSALSDK